MTLKPTLYISILSVLPIIMGSCTDEPLFSEGTPEGGNAITYEAYAMGGGAMQTTRSGELPELEPLVLSPQGVENGGKGAESCLYLHTYVSDRIGSLPGEVEELPTRGNQIKSADDLIKFHGSYKVLANLSDTETYFGWVNATNRDAERNVWTTDRTEYWPSDNMLDFYAVSPSKEFSNLQNLRVNNGSISFSYTLPKGTGGSDATAQSDLLLATTKCDKKGSVNGKAPLNFYHALSAVKFAIRDVANGEIESITISGVKGSGDCRLEYNPESEYQTLSWSGQKGSESYTQDFNYKVDGLGAVDPTDAAADILLNDEMPEKTFMMIPQQLTEDAEIIVTVKRRGMTPERIELRGRIRDNLVTEWKPGHEYVYTISTSKSNWIYVLEAFGNRNSTTGAYDITNGDQIYTYSPSAVVLDEGGRIESYPYEKYGDNAFFYVRSFRYHANNPAKREILSWQASHGEGKQYRVPSATQQTYVSGKDLTPTEWIPTRDALKGVGSFASIGEKKTITFAPHHQLTDWPGDTWMQAQNAYTGNSESNPWDLSTCGGARTRNTANSYVIDREGWYAFPLVYGNAIKNGATNSAAYKYQGTADATHINLVNYKGVAITKPEIDITASNTASIVWSDVYNTVSDVKIKNVGGQNMIVFRANKENMQQGSVVIALYDGNNAIWSWHIWITEHWLDHSTGQPNAYKSNGKFSTYEASSSGWRQRGDLLINNSYVSSSYGYYIAPYNLGWCDPKNVDYLRRPSEMKFTQFLPDGTESGKTATLKIMQDGERVEYKFGNNTYYQWGRKDPIVGFVDHTQTVKRNFGPRKYALSENASGVQLSMAIKNPQVMYYGGNDWASARYLNLWNNSTSATKGIKTVYDPCPPGYMVPPSKMFEFVGPDEKGSFTNDGGKGSLLTNFNGKRTDYYTYQATVVNKSSQTNQNSVWLTSTGNRWYKNGSTLNGTLFNGGDNFNIQVVYLWSSNVVPGSTTNSYGLALGRNLDSDVSDNNNVICAYFIGRKSMARPVRAIRE